MLLLLPFCPPFPVDDDEDNAHRHRTVDRNRRNNAEHFPTLGSATASSSSSSVREGRGGAAITGVEWACSNCTYLNTGDQIRCAICGNDAASAFPELAVAAGSGGASTKAKAKEKASVIPNGATASGKSEGAREKRLRAEREARAAARRLRKAVVRVMRADGREGLCPPGDVIQAFTVLVGAGGAGSSAATTAATTGGTGDAGGAGAGGWDWADIKGALAEVAEFNASHDVFGAVWQLREEWITGSDKEVHVGTYYVHVIQVGSAR